MKPIDQDLEETMDAMYEMLNTMGIPDNNDQLRMRIVGHNLRGLAEMFLEAHEDQEMAPDFQKIALGLLGTSAWLMQDLPQLED